MSPANSLTTITDRLGQVRKALRPSTTNFVGIDIGVRHITVSSLAVCHGDATTGKKTKTGALNWKAGFRIPLPMDPASVPSSDWIDQTIQTLTDGLPRTVDGEKNLAFVSLPSTWIHYQVVQGSGLDACKTQCDELFNQSIFRSDAHASHWPIVGMQHGQPNQDDQYVVASTSQDAAIGVAEAISATGYEVSSILPHGAALVHSAKALTQINAQCVLMLNRDGGTVAVNHSSELVPGEQFDTSSQSGCGLCRSLPGMPVELLKQSQDQTLSVTAIEPWLKELASEIAATLNFSQRANMCEDAQGTVLICGELSTTPGLDAALATLINRPVATWQYCGQTRPFLPSEPATGPADAHFALSLSLAHQAAVASTAPFTPRKGA